MVTASQRRGAVDYLKTRRYSERRACKLVCLSRSVAQYARVERQDEVLREQLKALAAQYPRYGYPTLHGMLKTAGHVINPKRTYRIYGVAPLRWTASDFRPKRRWATSSSRS
jgi:putative transposase